MIVEMRKLVQEANSNIENLGLDDIQRLSALDQCSKAVNYSPTGGQLETLRKMAQIGSKEAKSGSKLNKKSRKGYEKVNSGLESVEIGSKSSQK